MNTDSSLAGKKDAYFAAGVAAEVGDTEKKLDTDVHSYLYTDTRQNDSKQSIQNMAIDVLLMSSSVITKETERRLK
jgi:hypothetical protein